MRPDGLPLVGEDGGAALSLSRAKLSLGAGRQRGTLVACPMAKTMSSRREAADEKTRVLLVEDDREYRIALARVMAHAGYEIVEAATVGEALDRLRHDRTLDLVVSDCDLPDGTCLDILEADVVRSSETRVLAVTVGPDAGLREKMLRAGASEVRRKPRSVGEALQLLD